MSNNSALIDVTKYHGTGNDFIIVDATNRIPSRRAFAKVHCNRDTGVSHDTTDRRGADGVLFLTLKQQRTPIRVEMKLIQPDGSTAAMCGNGARVAAAWAAEREEATKVIIETPAGARRATLSDTTVTIEMGTPAFTPSQVPLATDRDTALINEQVGSLSVTAVNTGVPHAVAMVDDIDSISLNDIAPPIRHASMFPAGVNVTLGELTGAAQFRQRTYERGVESETRSCGTGAVAVGAVARRLGIVETDTPITVRPPGGELRVSVVSDQSATLTGSVEREFQTELSVVTESPTHSKTSSTTQPGSSDSDPDSDSDSSSGPGSEQNPKSVSNSLQDNVTR